jgi:Type IV secretion-system coupling protein DNA-binding domain
VESSIDPNRITYFGVTHTRGKRQAFGIRAIDRMKHMYVIGKTGMGKSTMLENLAIQDIQNGEGVTFIDPHGSSAEKLLDFIPKERVNDVVYFAPFDVDNPIGFNIMEDIGFEHRHRVVSSLMGVFERIWADAWSARMQYILQNTLLALLEYPNSTLLDVNRMLINKAFREDVIQNISDPVVASFWKEEFANFGDKYVQDATPAIQNKIGQFISNPLIRNIVSQSKSSFDFRKIMDEKKILIINLSKGRLGEGNASLLGAMIVVRLYLAALSRADVGASALKKLPAHFFYVDEFQSVVNNAFANILSESRKYGLALIIANQYIAQLAEDKSNTVVKDSVFGNVGTTIAFRVGPHDAQELVTIFQPTFTEEDLVGLGVGQIYLTLMIDGVGSAPFSANTLPPIVEPEPSYASDCIVSSRLQFSKPRTEVESALLDRLNMFPAPVKAIKNEGFKKAPFGPKATTFEKKDFGYGSPERTVPRSEAVGFKSEVPRPRLVDPAILKSPAEVMRERVVSTVAHRAPVQTTSARTQENIRLPERAHTERSRDSVTSEVSYNVHRENMQKREMPAPSARPAEYVKSRPIESNEPVQVAPRAHTQSHAQARNPLKEALEKALEKERLARKESVQISKAAMPPMPQKKELTQQVPTAIVEDILYDIGKDPRSRPR